MWRIFGSRANCSDEDHVERIRKLVARLNRWRRPLLVFWILALILVTAMLIATGVLVNLLAQMANNNVVVLGFILGMQLGMMLGLLIVKVVHGLASSLSSFRTERLMLRYHDALAELAKVQLHSETDECVVSH